MVQVLFEVRIAVGIQVGVVVGSKRIQAGEHRFPFVGHAVAVGIPIRRSRRAGQRGIPADFVLRIDDLAAERADLVDQPSVDGVAISRELAGGGQHC